VAPRSRPRGGSRDRLPRLARREPGLPGDGHDLSRPALVADRWRPGDHPADQPVRCGNCRPVAGRAGHGRQSLSYNRGGVQERDLDGGSRQWGGVVEERGGGDQPVRQDQRAVEEGQGCGLRGEEIGIYPQETIKNLEAHIAFDNADIKKIQAATANPNISDTNKLLLQTFLHQDQLDKTTNSQLLLLAKTVESPSVYTRAASHKVTARSRRNTVVIGALIGLIIGAIVALFWDRGAALVRD
jgi:hypothetical protein